MTNSENGDKIILNQASVVEISSNLGVNDTSFHDILKTILKHVKPIEQIQQKEKYLQRCFNNYHRTILKKQIEEIGKQITEEKRNKKI